MSFALRLVLRLFVFRYLGYQQDLLHDAARLIALRICSILYRE